MRRDIEKPIKEFIDKKEDFKNVLILEGARQVGKTFSVNAVLDQYTNSSVLKFNLETNTLLRNKIDLCQDFFSFEYLLNEYGLQPIPQIIFIDEAQESQKLGGFVRSMKEIWKNKTVILSGSSMSRLFSNCRVPVGRIEKLRLYPYSFREFLRANAKEDLLNQALTRMLENNFELPEIIHNSMLNLYDGYLNVGGLPSVVNSFINNDPQKIWEDKRYEIFLSQEEDFLRKELEIKHHLFKDATLAVANNLGFSFSLTRITHNHRDAKSVLSLLADWHILLICQQRSLTNTSAFHPKVYLYDIGLAKYLRGVVAPNLTLSHTTNEIQRNTLGGLIENAVYLNLLSGKGFLNEVCGWKKNSNSSLEIDFVIRIGSATVPLEIKAAKKIHSKYLSSSLEYLTLSDQQTGFLVSSALPAVFQVGKQRIINLPVYTCELDTIQNILQ
ncbi:MAG: AAA family ATPase [Deltaproteobacteria bacterium]|nr:AAA family ATPase [Deltaproteobacteria bacterium]